MSDDLVKVTVSAGKYTFVQRKDGSCHALRYGVPWKDDIFDGLTLSMAYRIEELEAKLAKAVEALEFYTYETTHLSAEEDDGSHWCKISKGCLAHARTTLAELKGQ